MKKLRILAALALGFGVSACATVEAPTRNAPLDVSGLSVQAPVEQRDYDVRNIRIEIPTDLKVSEANSFYPIADIVWRGDPLGDRRQQIASIFQGSILAASDDLNGQVPVEVVVSLERFHCLTERTRYTVGGVHSIKFNVTILHAETGQILEGPRFINGDLAGLGGTAAIEADRQGQTQKVRITAHLTYLFEQMLTGPQGRPVGV